MDNPDTGNIGTQDTKKTMKKRQHKTKEMNNTDPTKNRGSTHVFAKG
jgi:hypothetical protein